MDIKLILVLFCIFADGFALKHPRYYNPGDMSTLIGYQNHVVPDMTSLVKEASVNAHGGSASQTGGNAGPYNAPNFPAMSGSQAGSLAAGTGNAATGSASGSGSASFAGTNQWRCDSHVVAQCDVQCLDVDPKDGCAFCIPGCTSSFTSGQSGSGTGSTSQTGQTGTQPLSGSGTQGGQSNGLAQNPGNLIGNTGTGASQSGGQTGTGAGAISQTGQTGTQPLTGTGTQGGQSNGLTQQTGTLTGNAGTGQSGGLSQLSSGLSGLGNQGNNALNSGSTGSSSCPVFPQNCPKVYTKFDNGCLVCTILKQQSVTNQPTVAPATTTQKVAVATCPPKRCVPPCDKGIVLDANGCPRCLCPANV